MKPIKMLGLAAIAALLAMAFLGASSAMAENTALCKVDPYPGSLNCPTTPTDQRITHIVEHTLPGHPGLLLSASKTILVECDVLFEGDALSPLAAPLVIHGNFEYENCTTGCTVTEQSADSLIEVLKLGHDLADVTGTGEVHVNCSGINCFYNGTGLLGHALGALLSSELNGSVIITEQETHKTKGLLCPAKGFLDLTTTPEEKIYITG